MPRALLLAFAAGVAVGGVGGVAIGWYAPRSAAAIIKPALKAALPIAREYAERMIAESRPVRPDTSRAVADTAAHPVPVRAIRVSPSEVRVTIAVRDDSSVTYTVPVEEATITATGRADSTFRFDSPRYVIGLWPVLGYGGYPWTPIVGVELLRVPGYRIAAACLVSRRGIGAGVGWSPHRRVTGRILAGGTMWPHKSVFAGLEVPLTK